MNRLHLTLPSGVELVLDEPTFPLWEEAGWRNDADLLRAIVRELNGAPVVGKDLNLSLVDFDAVAAALGTYHATDEDVVDALERMRPTDGGYAVELTGERIVTDPSGVEVYERVPECVVVFREPRMRDLQNAADQARSLSARIVNMEERFAAASHREGSILLRSLIVSVDGKPVTYESARMEWPLTLRQTQMYRAAMLTRTRASDEAKAAVVRSRRAVTA